MRVRVKTKKTTEKQKYTFTPSSKTKKAKQIPKQPDNTKVLTALANVNKEPLYAHTMMRGEGKFGNVGVRMGRFVCVYILRHYPTSTAGHHSLHTRSHTAFSKREKTLCVCLRVCARENKKGHRNQPLSITTVGQGEGEWRKRQRSRHVPLGSTDIHKKVHWRVLRQTQTKEKKKDERHNTLVNRGKKR